MAESFSVFWTATAQHDLSAIIEHIMNESPQNARTVFQTLKENAQKLNTFPERGRVVPELSEIGVFVYRELVIERWRLIYKVETNRVFVMALIDSRQNAEDILFHRLIGR